MHSYYKKTLSWLLLDSACTYAVTTFTGWVVGAPHADRVALLIVLYRVPVWASVYLPWEYYWSWTPLNVCVDYGEL